MAVGQAVCLVGVDGSDPPISASLAYPRPMPARWRRSHPALQTPRPQPITHPAAGIALRARYDTPQTDAVTVPHPRDTLPIPVPRRSGPPVLGTPYQLLRTAVTHACRKLTLQRAEPWNPPAAPPTITPTHPPVFGTGQPPPELRDIERLKHGSRKVISLIDLPLWNKAGWKGAGFVMIPHRRVPPVLALLFGDRDAGEKIFSGLRRELRAKNDHGLSITIVTGINRAHPAYYRIIISPTFIGNAPGSHFVMVSRILTVTPATSENLGPISRALQQR